MNRLTTRLAAFLVAVVLLAPAAAHAEKVVIEDAAGDVVSLVDDMDLGGSLPAPDHAGVDVVRTAVAHGANLLRVSVKFRALQQDPFQFTVVRVRTPGGSYDVAVERLGGKPITSIGRGSKDVVCRELKAKVDLGTDTVTTSLPTACLGDPRWVQVGVGAVALAALEGQPDEGAAHADDALRLGEIRERIALGPKVRRG